MFKVIAKLKIPDSFENDLITVIQNSLQIIPKSKYMYNKIFKHTEKLVQEAYETGVEQGKLEAIRAFKEELGYE